ncbi:hypothetical protein BDZ89DRAFT_1050866 [Hymenopellis radicata]|nr:hypothetical protein BDZ89DRAFT_1050866 [Hymenopellis radicata]
MSPTSKLSRSFAAIMSSQRIFSLPRWFQREWRFARRQSLNLSRYSGLDFGSVQRDSPGIGSVGLSRRRDSPSIRPDPGVDFLRMSASTRTNSRLVRRMDREDSRPIHPDPGSAFWEVTPSAEQLNTFRSGVRIRGRHERVEEIVKTKATTQRQWALRGPFAGIKTTHIPNDLEGRFRRGAAEEKMNDASSLLANKYRPDIDFPLFKSRLGRITDKWTLSSVDLLAAEAWVQRKGKFSRLRSSSGECDSFKFYRILKQLAL